MATPRQSMPSHQAIREIWWRKLVAIKKFDCRAEVFGGDYCFSCGIEGPLERAHIVPHNIGGSEEAVNLHLLCPTCHTQSETLNGDSYWRWFLAKRPGDMRMTSAAKRHFGPRIVKAIPIAAQKAFDEMIIQCPVTLVVDGVADEVTAHVDLSGHTEGYSAIAQGGVTNGYPGQDDIGVFHRHLVQGSIITLRWSQSKANTRKLLSMGRECVAILQIKPIERRRATPKDISVFGDSIRWVANKWRLLNCEFRQVARATAEQHDTTSGNPIRAAN